MSAPTFAQSAVAGLTRFRVAGTMRFRDGWGLTRFAPALRHGRPVFAFTLRAWRDDDERFARGDEVTGYVAGAAVWVESLTSAPSGHRVAV